MSTTALLMLVAAVAIWLPFAKKGLEERREQKRIDRHMATLNQWGYFAGKLGKPPDFFTIEEPDKYFDPIDKAAMIAGWRAGYDGFLKDHGTQSLKPE